MGLFQEITRRRTARAMKSRLQTDEQVVAVLNRRSWWLPTKLSAVLTTN